MMKATWSRYWKAYKAGRYTHEDAIFRSVAWRGNSKTNQRRNRVIDAVMDREKILYIYSNIENARGVSRSKTGWCSGLKEDGRLARIRLWE